MCLLDHRFYSDSYGGEYELEFSAWGEGILRESGLLEIQRPETIFRDFRKKHRRYPKDISLQIQDPTAVGYRFGFTGIETQLLEQLETLKELILPASVTHIELTPRLETILRDNDTLIRGSFDSFAERFAADRGLHFRPADFVFANFEDTRFRESVTMTLVFRRSGNVEIKEVCSSPGSSAGNTFGGTFTYPLRSDFCETQTAEEIAGGLSMDARQAILEDGRLAAFMEKARTHAYYKGKN